MLQGQLPLICMIIKTKDISLISVIAQTIMNLIFYLIKIKLQNNQKKMIPMKSHSHLANGKELFKPVKVLIIKLEF